MDLTLAPTTQPRYESKSNKLAKLPVSQEWMVVLSYHLAGKSNRWIAEKMNLNTMTVSRILNNPKINEVRQTLLAETQKEFESLFTKVTDKIRTMLDNEDTAADGIKLWTKLHGPIISKADNEAALNLSAEDIVVQILNGNVNVTKTTE